MCDANILNSLYTPLQELEEEHEFLNEELQRLNTENRRLLERMERQERERQERERRRAASQDELVRDRGKPKLTKYMGICNNTLL